MSPRSARPTGTPHRVAPPSSPRVTRELQLPVEVAARSGLRRVDYADAFRTTLAETHTWSSRRWTDHVLRGAPVRTRAQLVIGWWSLGLQVSPARVDRVLGWTIRHQDPDVTVLGADSLLGLRAELIFGRHQDAWWFGTRIALRTVLASAVWAPVAIVHPGAVQRLLENAHDRAGG